MRRLRWVASALTFACAVVGAGPVAAQNLFVEVFVYKRESGVEKAVQSEVWCLQRDGSEFPLLETGKDGRAKRPYACKDGDVLEARQIGHHSPERICRNDALVSFEIRRAPAYAVYLEREAPLEITEVETHESIRYITFRNVSGTRIPTLGGFTIDDGDARQATRLPARSLAVGRSQTVCILTGNEARPSECKAGSLPLEVPWDPMTAPRPTIRRHGSQVTSWSAGEGPTQ